jgi:hypothetical protein
MLLNSPAATANPGTEPHHYLKDQPSKGFQIHLNYIAQRLYHAN